MISPWKMAVLHFSRQRLQTSILVISLSIALVGSSLLLRLYQLSNNRFSSIVGNIQAVVGPKSGGIEILLGALNLEDRKSGVLPLNLFETLRAGADIHFEDGSVVSSSQITKAVVPILHLGTTNGFQVLATDDSFLKIISNAEKFPTDNGALVGSKVAQALKLKVGDLLPIQLQNPITAASLPQREARAFAILPAQNSAWDYAVYLPINTGWNWLSEIGADHPIWHNKILSYFLLQMEHKNFLPLRSLINDRSVAQMIWVDDEKQKLQELSGSAGNLGLAIIIVILCLAAFSIFGMMSIRSDSLRVSTATLEAIGYSRRFIFSWMLIESCLLGLVAVGIGFFIELTCFEAIKNSLNSTWLIPIEQNSSAAWVLVLFAQGMIFSLLGSASSILQLMRVSVHQELKSG